VPVSPIVKVPAVIFLVLFGVLVAELPQILAYPKTCNVYCGVPVPIPIF
jgi:hypothetical protein